MKTEQVQQISKERKYFALIERVGSSHRYQIIVFIIMALINMLEASLIFILPYLLNQTSYSCTNLESEKCTKYVCSLDPAERKQYLTTPSPFYSLADQLGDFRCENRDALDVVQSITFLGSAVGMGIFTLFTEKLGRKNSLLASLFLGLIGFFLIYNAKSIPVLTAGVFIAYSGIQNAYQYTYCYSSEVVAEEYRVLFVNMMLVAYSFGIMVNSFTFFGLKHWRVVFFWFSIIPTILISLMVIYFIEKTPIDLLATEESQQIKRALDRIGYINGLGEGDITVDEIETLRLEYYEESKDEYFSIFDLCKFKSLRYIAIPLILSNFISNYLYYAPSFVQKNEKVDLFKDNIISGLSSLVSAIFTQFIMIKVPRKKSNYILTALTTVFALIFMLPLVSNNGGLKSVVFFLFRLPVSVYFNITYVLNFESFPTQVRACGANTSYVSAGISGVIQPWSFTSAERNGVSLYWIFAFFGVLGFIVNYWLKQTFGEPPAEIIQELQRPQLHQAHAADHQGEAKNTKLS